MILPSTFGDVGDVGDPDEREEVVLAERGERDVLHHHHLVVIRRERDVELGLGRVHHALEELGVHRGDPGRRALQPGPVGILADRGEQLAHRRSGALEVDALRAAGGSRSGCHEVAPSMTRMSGRFRYTSATSSP